MSLSVEDEHGTPWLVQPHDPGREYVNRLNRLGYRYMVLPRAVLCGIMDTAAEQLSPSQVFLPPEPGATPAQLLRRLRFRECMEVLCA